MRHLWFAGIALFLVMTATAHGQWTVTTYNQIVGHPEITSMAIADQYFSGARPQRFNATSQVAAVDLFESGGPGQFTINNPFPGLDNLPAVGDTNDYTARVTGTLVVNTAGPYDFLTDSDDGNRFRLDLNQNGTFEDATESIVPDGGLQGTARRSDLQSSTSPRATTTMKSASLNAAAELRSMPVTELMGLERSSSSAMQLAALERPD